MTEHQVGTREEWQAARDELLVREKELTRRNDELARLRRELPWVPIEKEYSFETEAGTKSLSELFDGRSQLLIYHFMFGPVYEAGCPVCSSIADNLDPNVVHLKARDTTLMLVSRAPLEKLQAFKKRMGWTIGWASAGGSDFNRDLGFTNTEEELKPFLEGEIPPSVERERSGVRHGCRRVRLGEPRAQRIRARRRRRLPNVRDHRPRARANDGLLRAARPDPARTQRGPGSLGPAPRRVRGQRLAQPLVAINGASISIRPANPWDASRPVFLEGGDDGESDRRNRPGHGRLRLSRRLVHHRPAQPGLSRSHDRARPRA